MSAHNTGVRIDALRVTSIVLLVAEVAITVLVGFFVRSIYNDPRLGIAVWFAGGMMTLSTIVLYLKIEVTLKAEFEKMRNVLGILETYTKIQDPDLIAFKESELARLGARYEGYLKGEAKVEGGEYYGWIIGKIGKKCRTVKAISVRPEEVYLEDDQEQNWLDANLAAANRGTHVERIFVSTKKKLLHRKNREVIRLHLKTANMVAYIVWKDILRDGMMHELVGGGLSIYDDDTVFWDESYFYQEVAQSLDSGLRRIIPRATIFRSPHPKVNTFLSVYSTLYSHVLRPAREDPWIGYLQKLHEVDDYMTQRFGEYEAAKGQTELTPEKKEHLDEWMKLRNEIEELEKTSTGLLADKNTLPPS